MHSVSLFMTVSLQESSGTRQGKVGEGLDLGEEAQKWRQEFGEVEARKLEEWVRGAIGDWEWLGKTTLGVLDVGRGGEDFRKGWRGFQEGAAGMR